MREYCEIHPHYIKPCVLCTKEGVARGEIPRTKRHRWVYPAKHVYVCKDCGIRKTNIEKEPSWWVQVYRMPTNGRNEEHDKVPPCVSGPFTKQFLSEYQDAIDANVRKNPAPSTLLPDGWKPPF